MNRQERTRFTHIILAHLSRSRGLLGLSAACLAGATLMQLLAPWPLKIIFDQILLDKPLPPSLSVLDPMIHGSPLTALIVLASSIAAIALVSGGLTYGQVFAMSKVGHQLVYGLRRELFSHVQRLSLTYHSRSRSGEMLSKLAWDTSNLKNAFTELPLGILAHLLTFLGMFTVMFIMNWALSLIILSTLPILGAALFVLNRKILHTVREQRKQEGNMTSRFNEVLSAIPLVQAFGREGYEEDRFDMESVRNLRAGIQTARTTAAVSRVVAVVGAVGTAATVFFGAWQVLKARMTPGDLLIFVAYVKNVYGPVKDLSKLSAQVSSALVSANRVAELLGIEPEIRDRPGAIVARNLHGTIAFENVSFGYETDRRVLHHVSFRITGGEKVALVGASGAGKSTLVSLLLRLFEPQQGRIAIDGVSVADYRRDSLRQEIGIVLQDTLLFGASVAENISYGKPDATASDIEEAARLAHAHDFIMSLPEGYQTVVGERGSTLSGGQRQRICLARAIVKRPSILILDEPTAAVDAVSASQIRDAMARIQEGKTMIVIAHQFADMEQFDRILVLDRGCLIEQGTHRQLLARQGVYANLYARQSPRRCFDLDDTAVSPVPSASEREMKHHA